MLSRTPSPTKRQALSSKDANVSSQTKLSPRKSWSSSASPQRSQRSSPTKRSRVKLTQKQLPVLPFKIFEDAAVYSTTPSHQDENEVDKENINRTPPMKRVRRAILHDLDIKEHKGYLHYPGSMAALASNSLGHPRGGTYLLDTLWDGDAPLIPSYVTPPRNRKYASRTQGKISVKRSWSSGDVKEKAVKKLVFGIHGDNQ